LPSKFRICGFAIHDLFMSGAKLRQSDVGVAPLFIPLKAQVAE